MYWVQKYKRLRPSSISLLCWKGGNIASTKRLISKLKALFKWRNLKIRTLCKKEALPKSTWNTISWGNVSACPMVLGEGLPEHIAVLSEFFQFGFCLDVCCVSSCRFCYCGTWISWLDLPDLVEKLDLMLCITATREKSCSSFSSFLPHISRDTHSSDAPFELLYQLHWYDTTA